MQQEHKKAIGYYMQALAKAEALGDRPIQITALGNTGVAYEASDTRKAILYTEKAWALAEQIDDKARSIRLQSALARLYISERNYDRAEDFAQAVLKDSALIEPRQLADAHRIYGELQHRQRKPGALGHLHWSFALSKKQNDLYAQKETARTIAELDGLPKKEAARWNAIFDSLRSALQSQEQAAMESEYKAKMEQERQALEEKKRMIEERMVKEKERLEDKHRNRLLLIVGAPVAGGLLLVGLIIFLVLRFNRKPPPPKNFS